MKRARGAEGEGGAGCREAARAARGRREGGVAVARRRGSAGARASQHDRSVRPAAYPKAGTTKKKTIQYPRLRHGARVVAALCGSVGVGARAE